MRERILEAMSARALLIVDDEVTIVESLRLLLAPWAQSNQLEILTAHSADQAETVLARVDAGVCILLSDVRMPGRSGTDLVMGVKAEHPEVICMLVTGMSEPQEMVKAIKAGVFSYILKPWDFNQLRRELDRALDLYRLRERDRTHRLRIEEELRWAAELQRALFAGRLPPVAAVALSACYRPMPEFGCGGDYCDAISHADGSVTLLVGDVAGHGVRAALVASFLKALVGSVIHDTAHAGSPAPLGTLLVSLNERICGSLPDSLGMLVSLAAVTIDPTRSEMAVASAGHPPPLFLSAGSARFLRADTLPLGAGQDSSFTPSLHRLKEGDRLVLYTDGLVEVRGSSMEDGEARLIEAVRSLPADADFAGPLAERMMPTEGYLDDVTVLSARIGQPALTGAA
jgi:sigma-B regulation protein RsbU (phosphoserine phosphatase)